MFIIATIFLKDNWFFLFSCQFLCSFFFSLFSQSFFFSKKQDKWIQQIISKGKSHQNPFLLFSAGKKCLLSLFVSFFFPNHFNLGIMGAGKTYTLKWLQKQHLLPLFGFFLSFFFILVSFYLFLLDPFLSSSSDFVVLDVDEFRVLLPEVKHLSLSFVSLFVLLL